MITITCSNPICGKSFLYDETKFPGAKKVQCPHCKTIQDLHIEEEKAEPSFFEEPKKQEPEALPPEQNESFVAPTQKREDFYSAPEHQPEKPEQPAPKVAEEPQKSKVWFYLIPVLVVLGVVLVYLLWPKNPGAAEIQAALPDFKVSLDDGVDSIPVGVPLALSLLVTPQPDSGITLRYFEGDRQLAENESGTLALDTSFSEAGDKTLTFWIEAFRDADGSAVRDTVSFTVNVQEEKPDPEDPEIDLRSLSPGARWFVEFRGEEAPRSLEFGTPLELSGNYYGFVNKVRGVKMEDGSSKKGIEFIPGEKATSRVYGIFDVGKMSSRPIFKAYLGFREAGGRKMLDGEVTCEIALQLNDGSFINLGIKSKEYDGKLVKMEFPIEPKIAGKVDKVRIDIISKKNGKNKVILVDPRIVKK